MQSHKYAHISVLDVYNNFASSLHSIVVLLVISFVFKKKKQFSKNNISINLILNFI